MRSLRVLTVVGLSIGALTLTTPSASACDLDSFGPQGSSGGAVRPDSPVGYSIRALGTDESPGASPWVITAGGVEVTRGMAVPDSGHEWTGSGTFGMPPLGAFKGEVTVEITFTDSGMTKAFQVDYDGTPAAVEPQAPAPDTAKAPPATQQAPAPATRPVSAPAPDAAKRTAPRTNRTRPREVGRPAPGVPARQRPASPAARAPRAAHVQAPVSQVRRALEPASAAPRSQRTARPSRPESRPRLQRPAPLGARAISRRVAADAPSARSGSRPSTSAVDRTVWSIGTGALLLTLLAGGAGLAAVAIRRRAPLDPESPDRLDEVEAELQELLAEERLRAEAETASSRTPVAP